MFGHVGKATGRHKYFMTILDDRDESGNAVYWQDIDDITYISSPDDILTAKMKELDNRYCIQ